MKNYFITGTDTGVGKTWVTAAMIHALQLRGLRAAPMKPVAAGTVEIGGQRINEDVALLQDISQHRYLLSDVNPYCFSAAIAPHIAAAREQVTMDMRVIKEVFARLRANADTVLVEGAGGFLVPLSATQSMAEIPQVLNLEVILVVGMRLGCLNHALLTAEAIRARGLQLAGWVANAITAAPMAAQADNFSTLSAQLGAPCVGDIPHLAARTASGAESAKAAAHYLSLDGLTA